MELFHLKLKRFVISNYRSIKRIEMDHLDNFVWLAGRNNAGKSNLLDAFHFLCEAATSFEHALASRGHDLVQVIHRKNPRARMDFIFDFAVALEKREELIQLLFAENQSGDPARLLATDFLSRVTLKVSMGRDFFTEELSTPNMRGDRPCLIFSVKGTPKKTEVTSGQLEALCQKHHEELPHEPIALDLPPEPSHPFRLRLGRPESGAVLPVSNELADGVRRQFASLEWTFLPGRGGPEDENQPALAAEETNLPEVLHWIYNNKPSQFRRIEAQVQKLVPRLGRLHTPTSRNVTTLAVIDPRDEELIYSMTELSSGTRAVVALITKIMLAPAGAWICLEAPEYCLHPQAQTRLMQFLLAESATKRIFGATHSPALAAVCPMPSLFFLRRDPENSTVAVAVTAINALQIIEEMGIAASFSFESEAVVFVEEADYIPLYEAWARKYGFRVAVQFVACGAGDTLQYHANARIALSRFVHTVVYAVFGNGSTQNRKAIGQHLELPEDQIITLDFPELEGCLLDAKAIRKAFPAINLSESELEMRLDPALVLLDQKKALRELLAEFKIGDYDGQLGGRIAEVMEAIPSDISQLFAKIEWRAKPFWEI